MGNEIHHGVAGVILGSSGTARATGKPLSDSEKMCPHIRAVGPDRSALFLRGGWLQTTVAMHDLMRTALVSEYYR